MSPQPKLKSATPRFPKCDARLLGTWKSDAKRTLREWAWKKGLSAKLQSQLRSMFGKCEVTYTRTRVVTSLRHRKWKSSQRYAVLGMDEKSVVIIRYGELEVEHEHGYDAGLLEVAKAMYAEPQLEHLHFCNQHYWISLGKNREFFRKIRGAGER